jgi:transposase InsO family protein
MANSGIVIQRSAPHTHQHNGVAERFNRTLISRVRSVLIDTGLPLLLWDEISSTVNYIPNLSPTAAVPHYLSPLHLWHGIVRSLTHLRVIGCSAFVHIERGNRSKLQARS